MVYSYEYKSLAGETHHALDTSAEVEFNSTEMSATGLLATADRDRYGDIFEVANGALDLTNHRKHPVAFVDHGLWYHLPIGKCEDPDGNYTVWIDGSDCYQKTYFSQSDKMAAQVYALYCEKILRANSIGYDLIEYKSLPPDPKNGYRAGKHILRSRLREVTWCGNPVNQDAVLRCMSANKINGETLEPQIKSMLASYIQETNKVTVPVNVETKSMDQEVKAVPADVNKDIPSDKPNEQDVKVEGGKDNGPLGSSLLRALSGSLKALCDAHEKGMGPCENEKVTKSLTKHIEAMKAMCAKMDELHKSEYEEGDDKDSADNPDGDKVKEPEDAYKSEDGDDDGDDMKSLLSGLLKSKNLTEGEKAIVKLVRKAVTPARQPEVALTPDEEKKLAQLERAIARREEQLNKILAQ